MSQTYIPKNEEEKTSYFEIGAGGSWGHYFTETAQVLFAPYSPGGTDCAGNPIPPTPAHYYLSSPEPRTHKYQLYGLNASYHVRHGKFNHWAMGLNGFYGKEKETYNLLDTLTGLYELQVDHVPVFAINPYFCYDRKFFGFDAGFHLGKFRVYDEGEKPSMENPENNIPYQKFYPQFGVRIGPQHIIYLDARYYNVFPTGLPLMKYSIGLASGMGRWNGLKIGAGYSSAGFYSTLTIVLKERVLLEVFGATNFPNAMYGEEKLCIAASIHYRFAEKTQELNDAR